MSTEKEDSESTQSLPIRPSPTLETLIYSSILTGSCLTSFYLYRRYFRQIPTSALVPQSFFRKRRLFGLVTSVGDGDNFHFFHTPGGRALGWGWLRPLFPVLDKPNSKLSNYRLLNNTKRKINWSQKTQTLHIRLAGVDAPECAHFGRPAQPFSSEALAWLRQFLLGRSVRILPLSHDQYGRTVAEVTIRGGKWYNCWKTYNVSAEMLKAGWATVYEAKSGAEFNGRKALFIALEAEAKRKKKGIFVQGNKLVTPRQYKEEYK